MKIGKTICCTVAALLGAGCASITPTRETSAGYAVYDVKAGPEVGGARIAEAIKLALQKNTSRVQIANGMSGLAETVSERFSVRRTAQL